MTKKPITLPITLTIDIGGSGIKGRTFRGLDEPVSERLRIKTPRPAKPDAVLRVVGRLLERQRPFDRVTVGFPGVVADGITKTAPNLDGDVSAGACALHWFRQAPNGLPSPPTLRTSSTRWIPAGWNFEHSTVKEENQSRIE